MNRIYYFTGTGNCLKLSRDIAETIEDCELISIGDHNDYDMPPELDRIGFVFPVYYQGLPMAVDTFLKRLKLRNNPNAYYFAVATYGALVGNALPQAALRLQEQGVRLQYGAGLVMFSNCVTMYNMSDRVDEITAKSDRAAGPIVDAVRARQTNAIPRFCNVVHRYYRLQISRVHDIDYAFHTNASCNSCGLCEKVCPVGNIAMANGKPVYRHLCEHCTACIQYCPAKAINYKNRTQKRRRYHHPQVGGSQLSKSRQALHA